MSHLHTDAGDKGVNPTWVPLQQYPNEFARSTDEQPLIIQQPVHQNFFQRQGKWQLGVGGWTALAFIVLLINIIVYAHVSIHYGFEDGMGTLAEGKCVDVKRYTTVAHLIINILGTLLLSGSNYCMQCLSAPTRSLVDKMHRKGKSADIGIPSIRNIFHSGSWSLWMWLLIALSSMPLHLLYNSSVYSSISAQVMSMYIVNDAFVQPDHTLFPEDPEADYLYYREDIMKAVDLRKGILAGDYERIETADCVKAYAKEFISDHGDIVLVAPLAYNNSDTAFYLRDPMELQNGETDKYEPYNWICSGLDSCPNDHKQYADGADWETYGVPINYCLSRKVDEKCRILISSQILVVVIVANAVKVLVMAILALRTVERPLLTLGDAIVSFLAAPDNYTKSASLLDSEEMKPARSAKKYTGTRRHFAASSQSGQIPFLTLLYLVVIIVCISLLIRGLVETRPELTLSEGVGLGLGVTTSRTIIDWDLPKEGTSGAISNILVANVPQVILSVIYFTYNALLTSMIVGVEWSTYAWKKKGARVSRDARYPQRTTYFLSLPYRYSGPLLVFSTLIHWLVSQSIYLVAIERTSVDEVTSSYSCGWSPLAILIVICLGFAMIAAMFALASRRYKPGMPVRATDSRVIAAACHVKKDEAEGLQYRKMRWGVVSAEVDVGHCAMTAGEPDLPEVGKLYA